MPKFSFKQLIRPAANSGESDSTENSSKLGTFGGVYTPSILTILGVIMYLRFGWVVGNVGLFGTLAIVTLSTAITFLTALSVSAIATDQVVRAGGAYYMISRSLGIETGGAVGIPLYLAQAFSVALYTLGFAESLKETFPVLNLTVVALITTVLVAALAIQSANIAIKAQYFIMAAIVISLLSLICGHAIEPSTIEPFGAAPARSEGFWKVFAVFFPAVTGIMAGVNMSGDLKDPTKSLPWGTLAAVGTGYVIYMVLPIILASRADAITLIENPLIMREMALWGDAILLGVWGATLSSAIGSILGAPRVLQALARDGILPRPLRWLGQGHGPGDEPRLGTFFTLGIALAVVTIGDLNLIAPVLTMFFLTTYLVLNVTAGVESFLQSPSFRPAFKVHWALSLLGAIGCVAVMFLINPVATVIAAVIVLGIYIWLERRELESTWGDVRRGLWMTLVRAGILQLDNSPDPRNWRPNILVLSGAPTKRWHLIQLADFLTHNRGLVTVSSVLPSGSRNVSQQAKLESTIRDYLNRRGIQALVRLITAPEPFKGAEKLVETYGFGPLVPNTILLGDTENEASRDRYCQMITSFHRAQRNVVIFRENPDAPLDNDKPGRNRRIDVWWGGLQHNGGLMVILADLLRTSWKWRGAEIQLKLVAPNSMAAEAAETNLESMAKSLRVEATSKVLVAEGRTFDEILQESSQNADLVFLGMATPQDDLGQSENYCHYYQQVQQRTADLPTTVLVLAGQNVAFSEILQKDG
ncbi:MAG: Na-K-Cl cotransporter [Thainema sp.]